MLLDDDLSSLDAWVWSDIVGTSFCDHSHAEPELRSEPVDIRQKTAVALTCRMSLIMLSKWKVHT